MTRTFTIEFIDYSGELIDPGISEAQLARRVREHMNEADGILVLAEAPREDGDWSTQFGELLKLRAAFNLIKRPPHGVPIAMVVNKWDRIGDRLDLKGFLSKGPEGKPEPPHVSLAATLRAKAGDSGGFDLRLVASESDVNDIPASGRDLVIVADVNGILHFRIFNADGKVVVNSDATSLTTKSGPIADLKKQLESLRPPHELTRPEKDKVIAAVTSIVGYTREDNFQAFSVYLSGHANGIRRASAKSSVPSRSTL